MDGNPSKDYDRLLNTVGFDDDEFVREFTTAIKDDVLQRCENNNVERVYEIEIHSESFTHYDVNCPIVTVWVTEHSSNGKSLPMGGFTRRNIDINNENVDYKLDVRRF